MKSIWIVILVLAALWSDAATSCVLPQLEMENAARPLR